MSLLSFLPIVGSLIGNAQDKKRQSDANAYNSPAAQRKRFEDAKINPEFGFANGGNYQQNTSVTSSIGDAFARTAENLTDIKLAKDQLSLERTALEQEQAQFEANQARLTAVRVPVAGLYGARNFGPSPARLASPVSDVPMGIADPEAGRETVTSPYNTDGEMFADPTRLDAGTGEERLGEVGELVMGVRNVFNDRLYNEGLNRAVGPANMSRREIHEDIIANPSRRDAYMASPNQFDYPEVTTTSLDRTTIFGGEVTVPTPRMAPVPSGGYPTTRQHVPYSQSFGGN